MAHHTMRAAWYSLHGPASDVLAVGELPQPSPAPGEVRVRMHWSGINPSDVKTRAGRRSPRPQFERQVPHSDGMGIIDAVGAGVDRSRIGTRVWTWNAAWGRPFGTAAQWVCLPTAQAVPLPEATADDAGACLGIPAMTAAYAVTSEGGVAGQTVLVTGGAGGVGHYAVQLARLGGAARVLTSVSNERKADIARQAGADDIILYRDQPLAEAVREATKGRGVDRIIEVDAAGNAGAAMEALVPNGHWLVYGSSAYDVTLPMMTAIAHQARMHFFRIYDVADAGRREAQAMLTRQLEAGKLVHAIDSRLPLDAIVQAHERVESGQALGNVLLQID